MATPAITGKSTSCDADDIALDHPHEGSGCAFCVRLCNCGNGQQI